MMHTALTAQLIEVIDRKVEQDGVQIQGVQPLLKYILEAIHPLGLGSALEPETVITAAEELFEKYVRPYDIPYMPDWIERMVDDAAKASIRPAVLAFFAKFKGDA